MKEEPRSLTSQRPSLSCSVFAGKTAARLLRLRQHKDEGGSMLEVSELIEVFELWANLSPSAKNVAMDYLRRETVSSEALGIDRGPVQEAQSIDQASQDLPR